MNRPGFDQQRGSTGAAWKARIVMEGEQMTNWKEKAKEWNEKYDDMFDEFPATESEVDRKE